MAIQEPTAEGNHPPCPRACNFHMIYGNGRAVIYIYKRYSLASWTYEAHKDYCKIILNGIHYYSIYLPIPPPIRRIRRVIL